MRTVNLSKKLPIRKVLYTFILASLVACSDKAQIRNSNNSVIVETAGLGIKSAKLLPWTVGPKAKQKITMGLKVTLDLPELSKSNREYLLKSKRVDSLLVKIKRMYKGHLIPIGAIIVPLSKYEDEVYFTIVYYAASLRPMFTDYICVPYNLSYLAKDVKVIDRKTGDTKMTIDTAYEEIYKDETVPFTFNNQSFIAGKNLVGEYHFQLAFYNSLEKTIKSSFYSYTQYASVDDEEKVDIVGCNHHSGDGIIRNAGKKYKWKK